MKTERLKLQREKALEEVQQARQNQEAKRIGQLENLGPLTSTPLQFLSPNRTSSGTSRNPSAKLFETLRDGRMGPRNLPIPHSTEMAPGCSSRGNLIQRNAGFSGKSSVPISIDTNSYPILLPKTRIPKKVEFSKAPILLNFDDPDISEIAEYNPYKAGSKHSKIIKPKSKEIYAGKINEDMEYSNDGISTSEVFNMKPVVQKHSETVSRNSAKAKIAKNYDIPKRSEHGTNAELFDQNNATKARSPETSRIPRILANSELLTRENMSTKKEIFKDITSTEKVGTEILPKQEIVAGPKSASMLEMPTIAEPLAETITQAKEEFVKEAENSTKAKIPLDIKLPENMHIFQKPEIVISSETKTINESNTSVNPNLKMEISTSAKTLSENSTNFSPSADEKISPVMEMSTNSQMLSEKDLPHQLSTEVNSESLSEIPANTIIEYNKEIPGKLEREDSNLKRESQHTDSPTTSDIPVSEIMEIVTNSGNEAAVAATTTEMKKKEGILSFLSSDEEDDDEDDSFFDSIPKPKATVFHELALDSQVKNPAPPSAEESSETLSDDDEGDIGHQLANLVATPPVKFVEHEIVQSEQDSQRVANLPPESSKTRQMSNDNIAKRTTESGLSSQPFHEQSLKQPKPKLHQKLAMHLGLDSKISSMKSEPDLKETNQVVEEDDFDFYD